MVDCVNKRSKTMQEVIRDGALRLMTSEATCDVILNCQGHRLMAHKVMLSIASPLLQELLLADRSETSLLVLPDINASIMAYILDYIYTGSVLLHSAILPEFLSTASLLKLKIEHDLTPPNQNTTKSTKFYSKFSPYFEQSRTHCEYKNNDYNSECFKLKTVYANTFKNSNNSVDEDDINKKGLKFSPIILQDERNPGLINGNKLNSGINQLNQSEINSSLSQTVPVNLDLSQNGKETSIEQKKKTVRKIPNLMPISRSHFSAFKARKGLYNRVFPSPWCPRVIPVTADPRTDCLRSHPSSTVSNGPIPITDNLKENFSLADDQLNDKNNNLKRHPYTPLNILNNVPSTEKPVPTFRNTEALALNLNTTSLQNNNNCINYENKSTLLLDKINYPPAKNYDHNLVVYDRSKDSVYEGGVSDCQNVGVAYPAPRVSDSTFSGTESSNSSCADVKSGEEGAKVDRSDEDNGKEDGDTKQKPYKCEDCGKQFSQLRNYKYHRSVHEGTKEFAARCPECGKVFNDRGYLSSHLKIHRDRKEYGCPHCPKRFNQRVAYNMHLRIHTGVKPHVCPTCGKGFSRKMLLKQHQRVHTGERPYQCPECGKSFADRSNMSLHARLHTGVKPYACNLCPKSFTKKHHLKTHMNYHTGLKPYVCQKCGLTFSQSSNMRTHYKKCVQKDASDASNPITS